MILVNLITAGSAVAGEDREKTTVQMSWADTDGSKDRQSKCMPGPVLVIINTGKSLKSVRVAQHCSGDGLRQRQLAKTETIRRFDNNSGQF